MTLTWKSEGNREWSNKEWSIQLGRLNVWMRQHRPDDRMYPNRFYYGYGQAKAGTLQATEIEAAKIEIVKRVASDLKMALGKLEDADDQ